MPGQPVQIADTNISKATTAIGAALTVIPPNRGLDMVRLHVTPRTALLDGLNTASEALAASWPAFKAPARDAIDVELSGVAFGMLAANLGDLKARLQAATPAQQGMSTLSAADADNVSSAIDAIVDVFRQREVTKVDDTGADLLRMGTKGSIALVFTSLVFAAALCVLLVVTGIGSADPLRIQVLLSCIACFIGMALACLGFGLFLIQAKGALGAELAGPGNQGTGRLTTNAPGLAVVICATIIVGMALNVSWSRKTEVDAEPAARQPPTNTAAKGIDIARVRSRGTTNVPDAGVSIPPVQTPPADAQVTAPPDHD